MGCCTALPGSELAELPRKGSSSNAVFIATPLGARVQVHFCNECKPLTMLLSVRSSVTLACDLMLAIAVIVDQLNCNALLFLSTRAPSFTDFESCFWFLSTCPSVSLPHILLYLTASEVASAVTVCSRYQELAGCVVNLTECTQMEIANSVEKLREMQCPVLAFYDVQELSQELTYKFLSHNCDRQICRTKDLTEALKVMRTFLLHLEQT